MKPAAVVRVRFGDIDAAGHVYFPRYLAFAHEGLNGHLAAIGLGPIVRQRRGFELVVARAEIDYRSRAFDGDELSIFVEVERVGTTSLVSGVRIVRGAEALIAEGRVVQVCFGVESGLKMAWPEDVASLILGAS